MLVEILPAMRNGSPLSRDNFLARPALTLQLQIINNNNIIISSSDDLVDNNQTIYKHEDDTVITTRAPQPPLCKLEDLNDVDVCSIMSLYRHLQSWDLWRNSKYFMFPYIQGSEKQKIDLQPHFAPTLVIYIKAHFNNRVNRYVKSIIYVHTG